MPCTLQGWEVAIEEARIQEDMRRNHQKREDNLRVQIKALENILDKQTRWLCEIFTAKPSLAKGEMKEWWEKHKKEDKKRKRKKKRKKSPTCR